VRVAVTGGAGFIGHHLVRGLLARGHDVIVIDDFSTGRPERLASYLERLDVHRTSVLDGPAVERAVAGAEVVFHHAAIASVARSLVEPRLITDVNVGGTIEVLLAASRAGVRRVILAGSSSVYGLPDALPCRETQRTIPASPYGASKLAAEHELHTLGAAFSVETVALRYFNVYGPGQDPAAEYAAVVPRFISAVRDGRHPTINGSLDISRDFVYVDDVVEANLLAAAASSPSQLTCNIASGTRTTLGELLTAVCVVVGRDVEPILGPPRSGDIAHSHADIGAAREALGFTPRVSLRDGISRTVAAFG
jgi:UDP-glucose 4-epimerase